MAVLIGELNKRIDIQAPTKASDNMGGFTTTWVDIATSVPAAVWPISAKEQIVAQAERIVITHRIRIRYRSGIRANWRIKYAGRYFNIVSIIDQNSRHRWLDILAKEQM